MITATRKLITLILLYWAGFYPAALSAQITYEPVVPAPPNFQQSTLGVPHYGPARQASTSVKGPTSSDCIVQVREYAASLGKDLSASPWHMVSTQRYLNSSALTVWGATLTDAYRFLVDGDRFEALDLFPLNYFRPPSPGICSVRMMAE